MARKANDPKASNWDRLSSREDKDTLQFRDVFEDQQLDRSKIDGVRKRTARLVLTWVVAAVVALTGSAIAGAYAHAARRQNRAAIIVEVAIVRRDRSVRDHP